MRKLLPRAEVTVVAGPGVAPSEPTDIPAAVAQDADVVILAVGGLDATTVPIVGDAERAAPLSLSLFLSCRR